MPGDQPRYFTVFDLLWEGIHLTSITTGCYVGWQVGGNFIAMLVGGGGGRIVAVCLFLLLWALLAGGDKTKPVD